MTTVANLPTPSKDIIKIARATSGLSHEQAAALVHLGSRNRWVEYENGTRTPDPARWELFLLRTGQHPQFRIVKRRGK